MAAMCVLYAHDCGYRHGYYTRWAAELCSVVIYVDTKDPICEEDGDGGQDEATRIGAADHSSAE